MNYKVLTVNMSQGDKTESFTISVLSDVQNFSAKYLRKMFQRCANKVLSLDGKYLAISKGKRFDLSIDFDGIQVSKYTTFFNASETVQNAFNKHLKARLEAAIIDIKDLLSEAA